MKIKRRSKKENGLNDKKRKFVAEYIIDFNAARAARAAGYSNKNNQARVKGFQLLQEDRVWAAVHKEMEKRSERTKITQDKVLYDLETQRQGAINQKQFTAAMRASELHGKHLVMFSDRLIHDATPEMIELAHNLPVIMQQAQLELVDTLKELAGKSEVVKIEEVKTKRRLTIKRRKKPRALLTNGNGSKKRNTNNSILHSDSTDDPIEISPQKGISQEDWQPLSQI